MITQLERRKPDPENAAPEPGIDQPTDGPEWSGAECFLEKRLLYSWNRGYEFSQAGDSRLV